jgi:hypothetical protein
MLHSGPDGSYRFLAGIEPYSSGVIAADDHEIVHVALAALVPWRDGFTLIREHLAAQGRPLTALCGVELRSPAPFTRAGFVAFNGGYCDLLEEWGLLTEGRNPVARTNVAPAWNAPSEPSLYAFSYTAPRAGAGPTFVVAGAGELRAGPLLTAPVVRPGETTVEALREKAAYVMHAMGKRLAGLGVGWDQVTCTDVYTAEALDGVLGPAVLDHCGRATLHGLRWHPSRPPIDELAFEMDCRGVRREELLPV